MRVGLVWETNAYLDLHSREMQFLILLQVLSWDKLYGWGEVSS